MAQLITRALELVPPDSNEAGRLLTRHGAYLARFEGDYEGAQAAFNRSLAIARREADTVLEMRSLEEAAAVDYAHLRYPECLEKSLRGVQLARRLNAHRTEVETLFYAVGACYTTGDLESARQYAAECLSAAERLHDRSRLCRALFRNQIVCQIEGDWKTARDISNHGLAGDPFEPNLLGMRVLLEYEIGDFDGGEAFLDRLLQAVPLTPSSPTPHRGFTSVTIPIVARIEGAMNRLDAAAEVAENMLLSPLLVPGPALSARSCLALLALLQGEPTKAAEQYPFLQPFRGTVLPAILTSVDRILGLLSQTMTQHDQATAHFEDALAFCRKAGYRPELAWTCHDYADCLLARNALGDRQRAMTLLDESLDISSKLGMRPMTERATALLAQIESGPKPAPALPDGLTHREAEVLRLIAVGKSSRDVADELVLSIRTVERHITNIYGKINARGRADATAYALGHNLVEQEQT